MLTVEHAQLVVHELEAVEDAHAEVLGQAACVLCRALFEAVGRGLVEAFVEVAVDVEHGPGSRDRAGAALLAFSRESFGDAGTR